MPRRCGASTRHAISTGSAMIWSCGCSRAPFMTHGTLHVVAASSKRSIAGVSAAARGDWARGARHRDGGGWRDGSRTADCSMFTGGRWRPITPLGGPRCAACSAIVEDEDGQPEMWVMGGMVGGNGRGLQPTHQHVALVPAAEPAPRMLSPASLVAAWSSRAAMLVVMMPSHQSRPHPDRIGPHPASAARSLGRPACVLNGRLHVVGGVHCDKLQVLEMSEGNQFSWTVKANLHVSRYDAASTVLDGKIWLMGGYFNVVDDEDDEDEIECSDSVVIYDPDLESWAEGPTSHFRLVSR